MDYLNEHLFVGKIGILAIVTHFIAALFAAIIFYSLAFGKYKQQEQPRLLLVARAFFILHFISVVVVFLSLYQILIQHYFEFSYAYQHSNLNLPLKYILSCFWEGQEGSFLLWSFWNAAIGLVFILKFRAWEKEVLAIVAIFQVLLGTMVLGIDVFGFHIGNNPFTLLRNEMVNAPIFSQANYLSKIQDGIGLNALLQNYWMVIHPPILFLGFALFTYPFAFVVSSLLKKEYTLFAKDILMWSLLSAAVLGLGVMMGAAWAYESLTFGGYWAWDPVENASLVPWLIMVAAIHCNLIYNKTKRSLRTTILFYILAFLFVLYSTYLTRSGVLGDTSVHAFTGAGITLQLLLFLLVFVVSSLALFVFHYKKIPTIREEEKTHSREFLMFVGSIVLFLSAIVISFKTSLPVINKIFHTTFAPPSDVPFSYNSNQIFVALIVTLLSGLGFFYKFKSTPKAHLKKHLWLPVLISFIITVGILIFIQLTFYAKGLGFYYSIVLTLLCSVFCLVANAYYLVVMVKKQFSKYGGGFAHAGFALLIVGILISSSEKKILSWNTTGFSPLQNNENQSESPLENITLIKNLKTDMGDYAVTFLGNDSMDTRTKTFFYHILFEHKKTKETFSLYPDVIQNTKNQEGLTPNPASKHDITKDIFVYLTYVQDVEKKPEDTVQYKKIGLHIKDTFFYSTGFVTLTKVSKILDTLVRKRFAEKGIDTGITAYLSVSDRNGSRYESHPSIGLKNGEIIYLPDTVIANNLMFNFNKLVSNNQFEIAYKESQATLEYITLKVFAFPYINIVWLGTLVMFIGFILSAKKRFSGK